MRSPFCCNSNESSTGGIFFVLVCTNRCEFFDSICKELAANSDLNFVAFCAGADFVALNSRELAAEANSAVVATAPETEPGGGAAARLTVPARTTGSPTTGGGATVGAAATTTGAGASFGVWL